MMYAVQSFIVEDRKLSCKGCCNSRDTVVLLYTFPNPHSVSATQYVLLASVKTSRPEPLLLQFSFARRNVCKGNSNASGEHSGPCLLLLCEIIIAKEVLQ